MLECAAIHHYTTIDVERKEFYFLLYYLTLKRYYPNFGNKYKVKTDSSLRDSSILEHNLTDFFFAK